jgi:enoyl-CoA hydratase
MPWIGVRFDCPEIALTEYSFLTWEMLEPGIAHVRMARAPVNAVNQEMYVEFASLFSRPDLLGPDVKAVILSGAGPHFCAGNDLDEFATMTPDNGVERMRQVREGFFAIQECPVPVIGAVHGVALGTGLAIAASCDFIVAARDARFGLPELTVGVMGGARHLARIVPQPVVRRMFFTGQPVSATELASTGGALIVCDAECLLSEAVRHARYIATLSPTAVRLGKQVLNRIESMDIRTGYEFEQGFTVKMSGHPDSKEALAAFREGRPPHYVLQK